jgi:uncharacterized protein (DUF2141 family)
MIGLLKRIVFVTSLVLGGGANAGTFLLEAEIMNATAGTGVIRAELHDSSRTFLSKDDVPAFGSVVVSVVGSRVLLRFDDVPPGRYAINLFQDLNDNANLDSNFLGIPTEPYGFSNNVMGRLGPPSFEQAAFEIKTSMKIEIKLR